MSGRSSFRTPDGGQKLLGHLLGGPGMIGEGDLSIKRAGGGESVGQWARRLCCSRAQDGLSGGALLWRPSPGAVFLR